MELEQYELNGSQVIGGVDYGFEPGQRAFHFRLAGQAHGCHLKVTACARTGAIGRVEHFNNNQKTHGGPAGWSVQQYEGGRLNEAIRLVGGARAHATDFTRYAVRRDGCTIIELGNLTSPFGGKPVTVEFSPNGTPNDVWHTYREHDLGSGALDRIKVAGISLDTIRPTLPSVAPYQCLIARTVGRSPLRRNGW